MKEPKIVITKHAFQRIEQRLGRPASEEEIHNWIRSAKHTGQQRDGLAMYKTNQTDLLFMVLIKKGVSFSREYRNGIYEIELITVLTQNNGCDNQTRPDIKEHLKRDKHRRRRRK